MLGEGMVIFGVCVATDFRNLKSSMKMPRGRDSLPTTCIVCGLPSLSPFSLWKRTVNFDAIGFTFSNFTRKSVCQVPRLNSPSVTDLRPISSCSFTTSRIAILLHGPERGAAQLLAAGCFARGDQFLGTDEAADLVGAEGGLGALGS